MVRSLGGLVIVALTAMLAACSAGGGTPTATPADARSSSTPSPSPSLDGDWIAQVADSASTCIGIDYRVVGVQDDVASVAPAIAGSGETSPALIGPATLDGGTVAIHLERSSPTKDTLDIAGTLGTDGIVHGTAKASGIHPGGGNGYTCDFAVSLVPAVAAADMPAFDSIAGTWCAAGEPTTCLTIASGRVAFGDDPPEATLDAPRTGGFGPPCYVTSASPDQPGGGFAIYYCPKGVVIQPGGGGVEGDIVAAHDNVAFDRIYGTQNPPYLQVYFRKDELAAALQP